MPLCALALSHKADAVNGESQMSPSITMEWWRNSFAGVAFAAIQLAAEKVGTAHIRVPLYRDANFVSSSKREVANLAGNSTGVLTGGQQMGEQRVQVLRGTVADGVVIT